MKRLKDMFGKDFDPIINAARNAVRMDEIAEENKGREEEFGMRKDCNAAWDKVAQYTEPKLKAIEVTGEDGGPVITTVERVIVKAKD